MKKLILTAMTSIFTLSLCFSQDTIVKKTNEDIHAKVLEVTTAEIKYKKFEYQDGPLYSILKSDVIMVRYENGSKDVFDENALEITAAPPQTSRNLFLQGYTDATNNYNGYTSAGTGTLLLSLLSPLVGLIPAITCSATQPKEKNLNYPNAELMKNPDYYYGYTKTSKRIKQGKVWTNWGIAFIVNLFLVFIILN